MVQPILYFARANHPGGVVMDVNSNVRVRITGRVPDYHPPLMIEGGQHDLMKLFQEIRKILLEQTISVGCHGCRKCPRCINKSELFLVTPDIAVRTPGFCQTK